MRHLIVRQELKNGANRTWRLRGSDKPSTLGTSRLADLPSADSSIHGIEGAFEQRAGEWYWLNFNPSKVDEPAEVRVEEGMKLLVGDSTLICAFHEKNHDIYGKLASSTASQAGAGTSMYEIEIVKFGERVLSTKVLKKGAAESRAAKDARALAGDKVTVIRRDIHLSSIRELEKLSPQKAMDAESRRGALIVGISTVLFALVALFGPKTTIEPMAALPPIPQKVTVAMVPMKMKKGTVVEKKMKEMEKQAPAAGTDAPKGGGQVAGIMRAVNTGRLSRLLGKVSAQAARSKEVIVSATGVKAGEGISGTALAAMGKVDQSGGDWNAAATGTGVTVSTAGRGGGRSTAGLGGLSAGGTGSAGVGLIEDESESSGGLDRDVIAGVIKSYLGQILYCYERQLSANPDLFGKVAVRFTIGPAGSVETQAIGDTTLKNATVEGCILNRVAGWKFPAPLGGTKVMVTYPFLFKSTN
ncbi:MAG: AgmX/PglI C-terminal domain-containing protein [Bdellovibrionaceae bacterium]|nr:AgmX/PglI C-terminal domain-containing protein [Pseudobdellovibrionaceae bacterium]